MIGVDAEVVAHFVPDVGLVIVVFLEHQFVADAVAATVFHHVAARVGEVHAIHRDVPEVGEHLRHVVVVRTVAVVFVVNDGRGAVLEDVPRTVVTNPVGIRGGVNEGDIAHVDAGVLETVLGAALVGRAYHTIHMAVVSQLDHQRSGDAQGVADHHALHRLKLAYEARCAGRWVGLNEVFISYRGVHFFLGEVVPASPVGFAFLGLSGHHGGQGDDGDHGVKLFHNMILKNTFNEAAKIIIS